mmetsp:Transcript_12539/g.26162  ORF Transcript_12539/g.26162 Transcript_12539/m.26162 type:complete len:410 (-) Transcript_12539:38-1267(-)
MWFLSGLPFGVTLWELLTAHPGLTAVLLVFALYRLIGSSLSQKGPSSVVENGFKLRERQISAAGEELLNEDCKAWGCPEHPHIEGGFIPATDRMIVHNVEEPHFFDNENCSGLFLPLHRPTYDKAQDAACNFPFGDQFRGKKRIWEMRFQLNFKNEPSTELFFGVELECHVPLAAPARRAMEFTVSTLRRMVGETLYHSTGDDPEVVHGELERPAFMMPLWAFDQFIETPEGEDPPSLTDLELRSMGQHRVGRVKDYRRAVDELKLRVGPTYTFCFWGVSRYFDVLAWRVQGIPVVTPLDLNQYCGRPPIYVVFYTLTPGEPGQETERRHLQSRKQYYFRCGFWSSVKRPSREVVHSFISTAPSPTRSAVARQRAITQEKYDANHSTPRSGGGVGGGLFSCCYQRHYSS